MPGTLGASTFMLTRNWQRLRTQSCWRFAAWCRSSYCYVNVFKATKSPLPFCHLTCSVQKRAVFLISGWTKWREILKPRGASFFGVRGYPQICAALRRLANRPHHLLIRSRRSSQRRCFIAESQGRNNGSEKLDTSGYSDPSIEFKTVL